MKYKKLTLNFNHHTFREWDTDSLNSYNKNSVHYYLGDFTIYVDAENLEYGKKKLIKELKDKYKKTFYKSLKQYSDVEGDCFIPIPGTIQGGFEVRVVK